MRAFIAVDLSGEIKDRLAKVQAGLEASRADVKWVEPENIHLTLKFLGEISEDQAIKVKQILDGVASGFKPFEITLSGIGAFPKLDYPRVIWIGIEKGKAESEEIAKKLEEELLAAGFPKDARPFSAHITIGRVRSAKNKEALKEAVSSTSPQPIAQKVSSVILYQSTITSKGPIYTPLHTSLLNKIS